jgi:protein-tyrosine-phosphatase
MGLHATTGAPPSDGAVEVLGPRGLDLRSHRSRAASPEALLRFDRVYAMTHGHLEALSAKLPPGRRPPLELLDPRGRDIVDPIGGDRAAYEQAAREIEQAILQRLPEWA